MRSETSFDLNGDLIFVDAVVVGPTGRATIQLLLDTGSVLTTLVPSIAQAIGYSAATSIKPTVTRTAAAEEHGYLVRHASTPAAFWSVLVPLAVAARTASRRDSVVCSVRMGW